MEVIKEYDLKFFEGWNFCSSIFYEDFSNKFDRKLLLTINSSNKPESNAIDYDISETTFDFDNTGYFDLFFEKINKLVQKIDNDEQTYFYCNMQSGKGLWLKDDDLNSYLFIGKLKELTSFSKEYFNNLEFPTAIWSYKKDWIFHFPESSPKMEVLCNSEMFDLITNHWSSPTEAKVISVSNIKKET